MSEPNIQLSIDIASIKQKLSELILFESTPNKIEEIILELKNILLKYYPAEINQVLNTITEYLKQQSSNDREKILTILQEHAYLISDITNFLDSIRSTVESYNLRSQLEKKESTEFGSVAPTLSYDELVDEEKESKGFVLSQDLSSIKPTVPMTEPQPQPAPEKVSKPRDVIERKSESSDETKQRITPGAPAPSPSQPSPVSSVAAAGPRSAMATEARMKSSQEISLGAPSGFSAPSSVAPSAKATTGSAAKPSPAARPSPAQPSPVPPPPPAQPSTAARPSPAQPSPAPPPMMKAESSRDKEMNKKFKRMGKEKSTAHVTDKRMLEEMESKELVDDNLSAGLDAKALAEELESIEEKSRYLLIDYFDQMNPYQVYPVSIVIAKHELTKTKRKQDLLTGESRSEVTGEMKLAGEAPLDIEISYPGCIVTPSRQSVSSQSDNIKIVFFITPLAKGKMNGTIKISQENNLIFMMELKYKVADQRIAKIISVIGLLVAAVPSLTKFLIGSDPNEQLKNLLPGIVAAASDYLIIEITIAIILFFVAGIFFFRYQGKHKSLTSLDF